MRVNICSLINIIFSHYVVEKDYKNTKRKYRIEKKKKSLLA
jgi:hypothetical protein